MDPIDQFIYAHPLIYCLILVCFVLMVIMMGYLYEKSPVAQHIYEKIRVNFRGLIIAFVSIMLGFLLIVLIFLYLYKVGILK
jgi:hypothetical protein